MIKSSELELSTSGIVLEENLSCNEGEVKMEVTRNPELSRPSSTKIENYVSETRDNPKNGDENQEKVPKFTMIFNKYNNKFGLEPSGKNHSDGKWKDKNGSKYTMIFNKDVTIRSKLEPSEPSSKTDLKRGEETGKSETNSRRTGVSPSHLNSMKLNDAETLMNLYGRSNLFIPDLTICGLTSDGNENGKSGCGEKQTEDTEGWKSNDSGLRLYNSLTSLSKNKGNRRAENALKNKIASLTSLETHLAREMPRKHVSVMQERKLFRVRSLDLSESVSSSDSDLERSFAFQKHGYDENQGGKESGGERSDKKSRGDAVRKGDKDSGCRKQVQWKSEVDVIYFESHLAADGDRSGEILGRVIEPLREEWQQQRTGFYAKLVPLPLGTHANERYQSLLKI